MRLTAVFPLHNQHELATEAILRAAETLSHPDSEVLVIDNGSTTPFTLEAGTPNNIKIVRLEKNVGVYPLFWEAIKHTEADIVAVFHSDLIIAEKGWDERVIQAFEQNNKLGLIGFVGSDEIDFNGGRGLGTTSNFQDGTYGRWRGSPAEAHGKRNSGLTKAAVVDGCAMIFRRDMLENIKQRPDFPPHHFYDRLLSCEVRERGWEVAVLGIACDHISGQTVNQEKGYHELAEKWCRDHAVPAIGGNWDSAVYEEAGRQWITEYRGIKHMVPCKV